MRRYGMIVVLMLAASGAVAAPPNNMGTTVDSYTPAQEAKARDAVKAAGYTPGALADAEAGNFFFQGTRDGQRYQLTVTPEGQVYPSIPIG